MGFYGILWDFIWMTINEPIINLVVYPPMKHVHLDFLLPKEMNEGSPIWIFSKSMPTGQETSLSRSSPGLSPSGRLT